MTRTKFWALALAALIGVSTFAIPQTAEAGKGWYGPGWKRGYWGPRRGYWGPGPYWGAGAIGLGLGLAVGSALAAPPVYVAPPPPYGYSPPPPPGAYGPGPYGPGPYAEPHAGGPYAEPYAAEPYAAEPPAAYAQGGPGGGDDWIAYCSSKFRSFNPQTGMYTGYDGVQRPCR
jgi:hypothetical protein